MKSFLFFFIVFSATVSQLLGSERLQSSDGEHKKIQKSSSLSDDYHGSLNKNTKEFHDDDDILTYTNNSNSRIFEQRVMMTTDDVTERSEYTRDLSDGSINLSNERIVISSDSYDARNDTDANTNDSNDGGVDNDDVDDDDGNDNGNDRNASEDEKESNRKSKVKMDSDRFSNPLNCFGSATSKARSKRQDSLYSQAQLVAGLGQAVLEVEKIKDSLPTRLTNNTPSGVEHNHFIDKIMNSNDPAEINRINGEFNEYRAMVASYNSALRSEIMDLDNQMSNAGTNSALARLKRILENALNDNLEMKKTTLNAYRQIKLHSAFHPFAPQITIPQASTTQATMTQVPPPQMPSGGSGNSHGDLVQQLLDLLNKDNNIKKDSVVVVQSMINAPSSKTPAAFTAKDLIDVLISDKDTLQKLQHLLTKPQKDEDDDYDCFYDFFFKHGSTGHRLISNDCIGVYKRYHLCNDQPCAPNMIDFRAAQCAAFNDVQFQGRKYDWEPYIKDDAECELNCKPLGMKYFATLNDSVIDGTSCSKPAEYYRSQYRGRSICVGGICKAVLASGVIAGLSANSGSVACGGLLCRPITGIFTRDPLPEDAYVHVASIPAGASNISITELKNSINLLVLRTAEQRYIFNGGNSESESGAYEAVGAIFDYHRIDGLQHGEGVTEWITCTGPIRETLDLMVYSKSSNPGVKYEYLLPIASESEENELSVESDVLLKSAPEDASLSSPRSTRRRKFNWKVVGFSECSRSCGGGTQTPIVRCVRENPVRNFSQRRCAHSEKPVLNENLLRCNTQPCPAYWRLDDWGECRCHQSDGVREREISCVQELASGIVIHVDNAACLEEAPATSKPCECPKNRRRTHSHSRYRTHPANGTQARHREKAGMWLMSEWNQLCSAECGAGVEHRTIFCDRSKPNTERCDQRSTPEVTRPCERERSCENGDWFAGPWSPCNGNCFNLTRTRQVLCIQNQLIVEEEDCRPELRPLELKKCLHAELEYCAPRWHYSEWSECSKSCDGGTQRRTVKCLEYDERDNTLRDSAKCRYSLREPIYRSCNTHKCDEPRFELLQNDVAPSCVDDFSNCQWAVKAKLCSYEYYQQNCCYSCGFSDA